MISYSSYSLIPMWTILPNLNVVALIVASSVDNKDPKEGKRHEKK